MTILAESVRQFPVEMVGDNIGWPMVKPLPYNVARDRPWTQEEWEDIEWWQPMTVGCVLITGELRSGKSMFMDVGAWKLRRYFGMGVVSDHPLKKKHGPYKLMLDDTFARELRLMTKIVREYPNNPQAWEMSSLWRKVICWDEAEERMQRRRPNDALNLLTTSLIRRVGHYQSCIMLASPGEELLEAKQLKPYIHFDVICRFHKPSGCSFYRVYDRREHHWWPGKYILQVKTWTPIFDSFAPKAMRSALISSIEKQVVKEEKALQQIEEEQNGGDTGNGQGGFGTDGRGKDSPGDNG